jgi:hypothetical protein
VRRVEVGGPFDGGDERRERMGVEVRVKRREVVFAEGRRDVHAGT